VQTVKVDDLGCRPVETPVWSADRRIQQFGVQTINTTIGSGKPQIVVLLLLLPLLLIVMPVVLLMIRSNTIWSADRADRNLHDSISLFVVSSDICMHHLHRHRCHHTHMFVWFNST
jgi:hypothetical protein